MDKYYYEGDELMGCLKGMRRHASRGFLQIILLLCTLIFTTPPSHATDNWNVEGANGVLYVYGALTESACRLEMDSATQEIDLGETGTRRLIKPGAQGTPVSFKLRLQDCLRTTLSQRDERTGALITAIHQPSVTLSFRAVSDMDNPRLVKVQGVSGLALHLMDPEGRDVRLGSRGKPLLVTPGQNVLTYTVVAERTIAPLVAGAFWAVVNFRLSYD